MENIGLLLSIAKLALEVFKDERGDRYTRLNDKRLKIKKEYEDELSRGDSDVSDLALAELRKQCKELYERIDAEAGSR